MKEVRVKQDMFIPQDIIEINRVFKSNGYDLFIVGGAVRDTIIGHKIKDYDLATNALPDTVEQMMIKAGLRTVATGKAFGVINVFTDNDEYEIATFRIDQFNNINENGFKNYLKSLNNGKLEEFMNKLMK